MSLFYLNPDDEPRECPGLEWERTVTEPDGWGVPRVVAGQRGITHAHGCPCNGTGRLGNPEARAEIVIYGPHALMSNGDEGFVAYAARPAMGVRLADGPTEALALEAAREALKVQS